MSEYISAMMSNIQFELSTLDIHSGKVQQPVLLLFFLNLAMMAMFAQNHHSDIASTL